MDVVNTDDQYVFIACTEKELPGQGKTAIFIPWDTYAVVRDFVETVRLEKDEDYWEKNRHDRIARLLVTFTGLDKRHISNSLSALGL